MKFDDLFKNVFNNSFDEWVNQFENKHGRKPTVQECEDFTNDWLGNISNLGKDEEQ